MKSLRFLVQILWVSGIPPPPGKFHLFLNGRFVAIDFLCLLRGRGNWDDDILVPNHTRNNSSSRLESCSFALPS